MYISTLQKRAHSCSSPIYLRDLHTLHTTEAGIHLCIAPNLRRLTLRLYPEIYDAIHLLQFLSLCPRLEHLNLEIRGEEMSDDLIIQIFPLAPCLVALEFNFMSVPGVWVFNELFEMLSRIGPSTSVLPKLQHLTLNVNHFDDDRNAPPLVYETERLLHMLESRSSPQILYPA
ncbi:hypothetical protein BJ138DRAFT_1168174 [Hygrophoropsis aurantiaca]|uniref:Uncharacterized protein n=1 Tax=Hygrophoropsis aurantiaca TaxID=72124 RepID=A0ACB7ZRH9_9AGAM|nr:hypothetical protein BJ138DRAFT_1168174 [Hygrophoropsis aurantiaca]